MHDILIFITFWSSFRKPNVIGQNVWTHDSKIENTSINEGEIHSTTTVENVENYNKW